jgi:dienelactone hydrolase
MRLALIMAATAVGCAPDIEVNPNELTGDSPVLEFDPAAGIVPFPNDLLRQSGKVSLPPQCHETEAGAVTREQILNTFDGFGTFEVPVTVTVTQPVDSASLDGRIALLKSSTAGLPVNPAAAETIPVLAFASESLRYDLDCGASWLVPNITIVPLLPLDSHATYFVAILRGITDLDHAEVLPSQSWALARQPEKPVELVARADGSVQVVKNETPLDPTNAADLEQIIGIEQLWRVYRNELIFLDQALAVLVNGAPSPAFPRSDILLAWAFTTATTTDPLDPAIPKSVAALAATLTADTASFAVIAADPAAVENAFRDLLEATIGGNPCTTLLPCAAVGSVVSGQFDSPSYQVKLPNPGGLGVPVPGPWSDAINPSVVGNEPVAFLAFVPETAAPAAGYPTVIFGHGLTRAKEDLFAVAAQLAQAGYMSVAIDWVAHGDRAVRISSSPLLLCSGSATPANAPQCFAPLFTTDLPVSRDNLRQSVLDALKLTRVLAGCGGGACPELPVDPDRLGYLGQSLGGLIGPVFVPLAAEIKAAVFNVGGVGWMDVVIDTQADVLRCPVVDRLIDAGVLTGAKWLTTSGLNPDALCLEDSWKRDPVFQEFAMTARWILDPAEGGNFVGRMLRDGRAVLVQEVVGDEIIPAGATKGLGQLLGLEPVPAALASSAAPDPTAGAAGSAAWVQYATNDLNAYSHASLLLPVQAGPVADPTLFGRLGTAQMQADAIAFFLANL